ncbi:MAG: hypothetical protein WC269_04885 [Candidatus Gracilibacteria bacterium]|jgi:hypothetical protein
MQVCENCGANFEVTSKNLELLEKVAPVFSGKKFAIPAPEICPACRMQRRMAFRNQSSLYKRKCSKTGKEIISMYRQDAPFPVYAHEEWIKDDWDAKKYGMDFDFSKPFFQQFIELRNTVPHMSLVFQNNINCDYCNVVGNSRNCYLIYGSVECEDCYYGNPYNCKQCIDSFLLRDSELCLECVDSSKLYNCYRCQNCSNSSDLMFCFEVNNSKNCFCCAALNRKEYCILNKQYSKEEYDKIRKSIDLTDRAQFEKIMKEFDQIKRGVPHRYYCGVNNENVTGEYIFNSKDCNEVYGADQCRDASYSFQLLKINDGMDLTVGEYGELLYYVSAFYDRVSRVLFSYFCWANVHDLIYCGQCTNNVGDCFGCVGLKNARYCILNKQYTKEEYEELVPKIIEHMRQTGEWGKFFPMEDSPFSYDETVASEFYPISVEENEKKPFKIIPQEKAMYDRFKVMLPDKSPKQRHIDRIALRNPMKLWKRKCARCDVVFKTTYAPERPEVVLCGECYLKEVY